MLVDCPAVTPFARPDGVIVAALVSVEIQLTEFVMFEVDPSLEVPTAVNCRVLPAAIESLFGVTAIETSVAWLAVWFVWLPAQLAMSTTASISRKSVNPSSNRLLTAELHFHWNGC